MLSDLPIKIDQTPTRVKDIIGYCESRNSIVKLPFVCMRKPDLKYNGLPYFCFTSHPTFVDHLSVLNPFMILHCFKNKKKLKNKAPKYLLPESDFVDPIVFPIIEQEPRWDYVYFTVNKKGTSVLYKGLDIFFSSMKIFRRMGLRGCVVVYFGGKNPLVVFPKKYSKYDRSLKWIRRSLSTFDVAVQMTRAKFVFFPNLADCSPRMIPESFLQNRPVVVNNSIWGGWHYLEKYPGLGRMFSSGNPKSLERATEEVLSLDRNQRTIWLENFGFERNSRALADLIRTHHVLPSEVSHVYFKDYEDVFKYWRNIGEVLSEKGDQYYSDLFPNGPFNI